MEVLHDILYDKDSIFKILEKSKMAAGSHLDLKLYTFQSIDKLLDNIWHHLYELD